MELTAVLTPAEEGGYVALNPETGTTTQGETVEEAVTNLQEATALYLSEFPLASRGHPVVTTFSCRPMPKLPRVSGAEALKALQKLQCTPSSRSAPWRVSCAKPTSRTQTSSPRCKSNGSSRRRCQRALVFGRAAVAPARNLPIDELLRSWTDAALNRLPPSAACAAPAAGTASPTSRPRPACRCRPAAPSPRRRARRPSPPTRIRRAGCWRR